MIPRRIWLNLAAFLVLFAVLGNWALRNVLDLDALSDPYRITATFESSPGLRPNVEVTYLGVPVGSIERLRLEGGGVVAELDMDKGTRLPVGITASVRRKSAVGEPYVALEPPPGHTGGGPVIDPGEGYVIPVGQTRVPLAYGELFASLDRLISAVEPDDLTVVVRELATALGGRGPALRQILADVGDATSTLADRSEVFDALASDLTHLTATIAAERDRLGSSFDDVAALVTTLAEHRTSLEALLAEAPAFGAQVAALLDTTVADLGCAAADLGPVFAALGTDEHLADLRAVLAGAGRARDALDSALVEPGERGADGPYLGGSFVPDLQEAPAPYDPRPELPTPPAPVPCPGGSGLAGPGPGPGDAGAAAGDGVPTPPGGTAADAPGRPERAVPEVPASTTAPDGADRFPWAAVVAAAAVGAVAVLFAVVRPRRVVRRRDSAP